MDRPAETVDAGHVGKVERHECRLSAGLLHFVVELLQTADCAGDGNDVRAGRRQFPGNKIADAARSAGDEGDAAGKVEF